MLKQRRALPSLDLLKGFEAAARNLSFTKAAAELYVTQSAVSRQVKTLEEQLGVALFRRHHRDLRLTEEGQTLYKTSGEVLRLLRDVAGRLGARDVAQQAQHLARSLRSEEHTSELQSLAYLVCRL